MFRKLSLLVVSLTCFNVVADCNDDANAARLDNRLDEAEALCADCLDTELRRLARTYMLLDLTHYDNGDHKKAIAQYNKALETVPTYVTALTNRGLSYALSRNMKAAYKDFAAAIESNPEYMRAHYYQTYALAKDGRKQDAIGTARNASTHHPDWTPYPRVEVNRKQRRSCCLRGDVQDATKRHHEISYWRP
jgi:tetratricopeptide (TPR) repeat protein